MIHILAAAHIGFIETTFFGKTNILDISILCKFQIVFGGESAVERYFERIAIINFFLAVEHRNRQIHIGRIAALDYTVQNQVGCPTGKANLVAVNRITPILDNDVGMRLKNRDNFFLGRDLLSHYHPPMCLIDDSFGKQGILLDLIQQGIFAFVADIISLRVHTIDLPQTS